MSAASACRSGFFTLADRRNGGFLHRLSALISQKNYAEAEPLLLSGYEGLKQREKEIPPQGKIRLNEALERLVKLYDSWDQTTRPTNGARS